MHLCVLLPAIGLIWQEKWKITWGWHVKYKYPKIVELEEYQDYSRQSPIIFSREGGGLPYETDGDARHLV